MVSNASASFWFKKRLAHVPRMMAFEGTEGYAWSIEVGLALSTNEIVLGAFENGPGYLEDVVAVTSLGVAVRAHTWARIDFTEIEEIVFRGEPPEWKCVGLVSSKYALKVILIDEIICPTTSLANYILHLCPKVRRVIDRLSQPISI